MIGNAEAFFIPDTPAQPIAFDAYNQTTSDTVTALRCAAGGVFDNAVAQPIPLDMMNIRGRPSDDGRANRIGRGYGEVGDPMFTITKANHHAVAQPIPFDTTQITSPQNGNNPKSGDPCHPLAAGAHPPAIVQPIGWSEELTASVDMAGTLQYGGQGGRHDGVMTQAMAVRRLSPKECERLQGFPDNYTDIRPKGKATPDGPRYKALGNSMAVPVMHWIGQRIQAVDLALAKAEVSSQ
jgi:site-specific DNA-cytosine methylase